MVLFCSGDAVFDHSPTLKMHWLLASMWNRVVNVSDVEIRLSPTSPVQLVTPPGPNQVIVPLAGFFEVRMSGGAYTGVDATASWHLEVGTLKTNPVLLSGILDSSDEYGWAWTLLRQDILGTVPPFLFGKANTGARSYLGAGKPLFLHTTNTSNFGGGNKNNSVNVTVSYILLNLN